MWDETGQVIVTFGECVRVALFVGGSAWDSWGSRAVQDGDAVSVLGGDGDFFFGGSCPACFGETGEEGGSEDEGTRSHHDRHGVECFVSGKTGRFAGVNAEEICNDIDLLDDDKKVSSNGHEAFFIPQNIV